MEMGLDDWVLVLSNIFLLAAIVSLAWLRLAGNKNVVVTVTIIQARLRAVRVFHDRSLLFLYRQILESWYYANIGLIYRLLLMSDIHLTFYICPNNTVVKTTRWQ